MIVIGRADNRSAFFGMEKGLALDFIDVQAA